MSVIEFGITAVPTQVSPELTSTVVPVYVKEPPPEQETVVAACAGVRLKPTKNNVVNATDKSFFNEANFKLFNQT
jgi:hypothetical protein